MLLALVVLVDVVQIVVRLPQRQRRGLAASRNRTSTPRSASFSRRKVSTGWPGATAGAMVVRTSLVTCACRSHMPWISLSGHPLGQKLLLHGRDLAGVGLAHQLLQRRLYLARGLTRMQARG